MTTAVMIVALFVSQPPCVLPPSVRQIDKLRPLSIETPLVEGGKPAAIVAASGVDSKLAAGLIARVKNLSGITLPLVDDKQVTDEDLHRLHVIVIGNYLSNKVAERLYVRGWTYEDYVYPGIAGTEPDSDGQPVSGYVIRTVHDPFGFGHNFIVLAGSEPAGTAEAVKQFTASLGDKNPLVVPQTVKVRFGTKQLMKPAYSRREIPQAQVDRIVEQIRRTVSRMTRLHNNVWYQTESHAMGYHLTGNSCWGRIYKAQMEILAENLDRFNALPNNYIEGVHKLLPAWDLMEETPFFSDAERLKYTNVVLEVACRNATAWEHYLKKPRREALDSHGGERVQSLRLAGLYFGNRYGINRHWVTMTDEAIRFMNETPRSCDGYRQGCGHCVRLTQYARHSGDMAYFEGGDCRQQADLVMTCTDNQGLMVSIGDQDNLDVKIDRNWNVARFFGEVAWFYKDPSYLWFARNLAYHELPFEGFTTGQLPTRPDRLIGLNVLPVDKNLYDLLVSDDRRTLRTFELAPPITVPREKSFDKLSFREALDPQKQYLLLDGIGGLDHGHIDGNSISRFSDLERIWLVDVGWTRCYTRDHNMLLVVKDGQSRGPQKLARLDLAAELDSMVFTRTTTEDYNGIDWSRHQFWLKGEYVLALDRATARTSGEYSLRLRWRCPGEATLREDGLLVTQSGPQFRVLNADGSRPRLRQLLLEDTNDGIREYPHGNRRGETVVFDNVFEKSLVPGKEHIFQNLFFARSDKVRRDYRLEHVDDTTVRITSPQGTSLAGLAKAGSVFFLAPGRFCVAGAQSLGEPPLFRADHPLDLEYDFIKGRGVVIARQPTRLTLPAAAGEGKLDGMPVSGAFEKGMTTLLVPEGKHTVACVPSPEANDRAKVLAARFSPTAPVVPVTKATFPQILTMLWEARPPQSQRTAGLIPPHSEAEIMDMTLADLDGDGSAEILTAGRDGTITVLGLDGKLRWSQAGMEQANAVAVVRHGTRPLVFVGCRKAPYLHVFDAQGNRVKDRWANLSPPGDSYRGVAAAVSFLAAADINGDGQEELLVASRPAIRVGIGGHCYCYDSTGRMLWQQRPVEHEVAAMTVASLQRGGPKLFLAAGTFNSCGGVDPAGRAAFRADASHRPTVILAADLDGDGTSEVLLGGSDNYVHLHGANGRRHWMHNVGGQVSGIVVADVNGDGKPEIIVATAELGYNLLVLDARGKRLWQAKAGEEINALAVGKISGQRDVEIIVGTDGSKVQVFDGRGNRTAEAGVPGHVARLSLCPSGRPGKSEIIAALKNGSVLRLKGQ
jgi:hypothetical protein